MNWKQLISNKRFGMEALHEARKDDRSEFQRDYDRLIFSAPFRRRRFFLCLAVFSFTTV